MYFMKKLFLHFLVISSSLNSLPQFNTWHDALLYAMKKAPVTISIVGDAVKEGAVNFFIPQAHRIQLSEKARAEINKKISDTRHKEIVREHTILTSEYFTKPLSQHAFLEQMSSFNCSTVACMGLLFAYKLYYYMHISEMHISAESVPWIMNGVGFASILSGIALAGFYKQEFQEKNAELCTKLEKHKCIYEKIKFKQKKLKEETITLEKEKQRLTHVCAEQENSIKNFRNHVAKMEAAACDCNNFYQKYFKSLWLNIFLSRVIRAHNKKIDSLHDKHSVLETRLSYYENNKNQNIEFRYYKNTIAQQRKRYAEINNKYTVKREQCAELQKKLEFYEQNRLSLEEDNAMLRQAYNTMMIVPAPLSGACFT